MPSFKKLKKKREGKHANMNPITPSYDVTQCFVEVNNNLESI